VQLETNFYRRDALTVAKELLGKVIVRQLDRTQITARIVETEAYIGPEDKACHAYQNKKTKRTKPMFKPGGFTYVYLIYGMYYCFNIVTGEAEKPEAILIRAVEPISGLDVIKQNRDIKSNRLVDLTNGPGKLCQGLEIDKELNEIRLTDNDSLSVIEAGEQDYDIVSAPRINIDYAEEYKDKKWRFYLADSSFVSG
jgi:DNA-3-methyladenine glycosylase